MKITNWFLFCVLEACGRGSSGLTDSDFICVLRYLNHGYQDRRFGPCAGYFDPVCFRMFGPDNPGRSLPYSLNLKNPDRTDISMLFIWSGPDFEKRNLDRFNLKFLSLSSTDFAPW